MSRIILLNGVSSAGKSTIAAALDRRLGGVWMHSGVDHWLRTVLPSPKGERLLSVAIDGDPPRVTSFDLTADGFRVLAAAYHAYAALLKCGNDLIVDDVIFDPRVLREAVYALNGFPVLFVGVRCPIDIAEAREAARGDRRVGLAAVQAKRVHAHGIYDMEVDSSEMSPDECAELIQIRVEEGPPPSAFERLHATFAS